MRILVVLAFLGILGSLASALVYLMRDKGGTNRTVNALTVRIGLSIALFLFVLFAHHMGWIETTGLPAR
ncbi:twin transmembrane helix small protein [Allopusillimonas ginsengisoli]|uniref:twin transmembrane helix small protein n=1 Tax=Allopusillimonas ginsengisoli TaxID=453575 RepID=UPI001020A669|nr:twin transmembrane helix small protein [Allopusillimonas ginsengisoli]TEA76875.1 twin transmembrane helix small protein [Allopusillimonas ginsengisoli]